MSSNVLQPNPPPHNTKIISSPTPCPQTALLQPPKKNHIFINVSKDHFSRFMWAFLGLSWSDFHRENREPRTFPSLSPPSLLLFLLLLLSSLSPYLLSPPFIFHLPSSSPERFINPLCDPMSKKMKRAAVESSSPYAGYEDAKSRFKHQSLLQDYHDLQKETEAMRRKLQSVKQNKLTLLAEVRFLRRRYKYLLKNMGPKTPPEPELKQPQNSVAQLKNIPREKNHSGKQAASMRIPVPVFGGNTKERIYKGKAAAAAMPNSDPSYELNQKTRVYGAKEAVLRNPVPAFDLNQKDRIYSGKETVERNPVPFLDLNKISREEEEFQVNIESMGVEQQKSVIRGGNDDQLSDMKLLVCRSIGNGPNRAGKRKISWQDQVALRV